MYNICSCDNCYYWVITNVKPNPNPNLNPNPNPNPNLNPYPTLNPKKH